MHGADIDPKSADFPEQSVDLLLGVVKSMTVVGLAKHSYSTMILWLIQILCLAIARNINDAVFDMMSWHLITRCSSCKATYTSLFSQKILVELLPVIHLMQFLNIKISFG